MTINYGEINRKATFDIGDRVLAHNGQTGYIVEMNDVVITIECARRIIAPVSNEHETITIVATEYDCIVSPRASVLTCEFA